VAAGLASQRFGLRPTVTVYAAAVIALAAFTLIAAATRREPAPAVSA
jgi:hypothetical protein